MPYVTPAIGKKNFFARMLHRFSLKKSKYTRCAFLFRSHDKCHNHEHQSIIKMCYLPEVGAATKYLKPLRATPLHWLVVAATVTSVTFSKSRNRYALLRFSATAPNAPTHYPIKDSEREEAAGRRDGSPPPLPSLKKFLGPALSFSHPEIHKGPKENSSIELQWVRNGMFRVLLTVRPSRVSIGSRFETPVASPGTEGLSSEPQARNIGWTQEGPFRFARECKQTDLNIAGAVHLDCHTYEVFYG